MVQTILGSGGGIGVPLARELRKYTENIRLVSRNPARVNETDELFAADLTDPVQIDRAVAGSEVVYVTVGFKYSLKVWQKGWPPFMDSVIKSCLEHNAKLVFFDNIYIYAEESVPFMTEGSKIDPPSEKGKVRKRLRDMILESIDKENLTALIARSADFYGPGNKNSALTIMVAENLLKGRKAQIFGNPDKIHTFTYTPDAAIATALLGNTPDAYNQEWHLPTTKYKLTTRKWVDLIAKELNSKSAIQKVPEFMIQLMGMFVPIMREFPEMLYQYENDYIFDSSKFERRFGIFATPPDDGIKKLVESLKK